MLDICGHTFMFALSQRMYLFEANLNLLTDTYTNSWYWTVPVRVEPHYQLPSLLVHWSYREKNTQYYTTMGMYTNKHGEPSLQLLQWQVEQRIRGFIRRCQVKNIHSFLIRPYFKINFMAPFYGWGSIASRLEPLWGGSLLFTTKFPNIPGTHFTNLGRMKGWVDPVVLASYLTKG